MTSATNGRFDARDHVNPSLNHGRLDRYGKRLLATHIDELTHRAFKTLAAKQGTTNLGLMYEAIALVLAAHGEPVPPTTEAAMLENNRPATFTAFQPTP